MGSLGTWLAPLKQLTLMRIRVFTREPEAMFWVLVFPLMLAVILGWAFRERVPAPEPIGVLAADAAAIVQVFDASQMLEVVRFDDAEAAAAALRRGRVGVLVEAPPAWTPADGTAPLTLRFDPQRPESELARLRIDSALAAAAGASPDYGTTTVSDTGARYIDWLFPGLLGMNLMGTGIWSIGFAIADMRQKKLLRRFLVTPMPKWSFLGSFVLARGVFLAIELGALMAFALLLLKIPLNGSVVAFLLVSLLGTLAFAAVGLLIAARPRTLEGVSGLMNAAMLPMWLFSGVFFSYERFPEATHSVIQLLPLTALNDGLRGVMLDGMGILQIAPQLGVLFGWCAIGFALAISVFRWE